VVVIAGVAAAGLLTGIGDFRWGENNRAQEQAIESMACIMFAPALPAAEKNTWDTHSS